MRANLVPVILLGLEGVTAKLAVGGKVADVACGSGKALLEMAKAYPHSEFHGFDSSELAIGLAREDLIASGLTNVTLHHAPASALEPNASFDFILTRDCLYDMTDPAGATRAIRAAIKPGGVLVISDFVLNDDRTPNRPWTGIFHTFMLLQSKAGATWRQADYRAWLGEAGFQKVEFSPTMSPSTLVIAR